MNNFKEKLEKITEKFYKNVGNNILFTAAKNFEGTKILYILVNF